MLEYGNLSAIEFEYLCQDIMSSRLGVMFRRFAPGKDGGVDLHSYDGKIVVQVKHYYNSSFSDLYRSLEKEKDKLDHLSLEDYYVCVSKILTPFNRTKIFNLFDAYMSSKNNIIDILEIDEIVCDTNNTDILRKHFKLWLSSTNILNELYNQSIFIDSETLLYDVKQELPYYVETNVFGKSKTALERDRLLLLIGSPGVGKTTISKMLVLYFASVGYRVRYTTNGCIDSIKNSLSSSPNTKEIILLDDCLGQCYFNLRETQETELSTLIKYVFQNKNKILLLNSRVSIFNEAKERSMDFLYLFDNLTQKVHIIDADGLSLVEKALIFFNHLKRYQVPNVYYEQIREDKKYREIVTHQNYNPRIIEYVTWNYHEVSPLDYYDYIIEMIRFPHKVWQNEFEQRLSSVDRYFMYTIYTLTDTYVEISALEKAFNHVIKNLNDIDITINHFENIIKRLSKSLIKIIARDQKLVSTPENMSIYVKNYESEISVLNPSINDYMGTVFKNPNLKSFFLNNYLYVEQLARLTQSENEFWIEISKVIKDRKLFNIKTINPEIESSLQLYIIVKLEILDSFYKGIIINGLKNFPVSYHSKSIRIIREKESVIKLLFCEPFWSFYHIQEIIESFEGLESIFSNLDLDSMAEIIKVVYDLMQHRDAELIQLLCKASYNYLKTAAQDYADDQSSQLQDEYGAIADRITDNLYDILEPLEDIGIDYEAIIQNVDINEWFIDENFPDRDVEDNSRKYENDEIDLILDRIIAD